MKKIVFLGALITAVSVQAGVLNWQVSQGDISDYQATNAYLYDSGNNRIGAMKIGGDSQLAGASETSSFYVELVNYEGQTIARSDSMSYADLVSKGFATAAEAEAAKLATWHPDNYKAAPEPTSALLMMMGVAFLGLKRRKV